MMNAVTKSSLAAGYYKATTQVVTASLKPVATAFPSVEQSLTLPGTSEKLNNYTLSKHLPTGALKISSGPGGNHFYYICNVNFYEFI